MKRTTLLHAELSEVIARLGHGDLLVIGDAGLPIPDGPRRIDLAVSADVPRFQDVLAAVLAEMQVESATTSAPSARRSPRRISRAACGRTCARTTCSPMWATTACSAASAGNTRSIRSCAT